jgi:hypothetical protein
MGWLRSYTDEGLKWAYNVARASLCVSVPTAVGYALLLHYQLGRGFPYDIEIVYHTPESTTVVITVPLKGA